MIALGGGYGIVKLTCVGDEVGVLLIARALKLTVGGTVPKGYGLGLGRGGYRRNKRAGKQQT